MKACEDRHRCAQAARLRHRHLRAQPCAATGAAGGCASLTRAVPRAALRQEYAPEYVVRCREQDCDWIDDLGSRFRAVIETAGNYSVAEQFAIPIDLRRESAELFHAPHYVLPPLTPCRSVVTIHDCIHLRFPQYLPSKLGYAYARAQMWT